MSFKVIKPNWEYRADGSLALKDPGSALLEFAPAQQGTGSAPGERRFQWDNKTVQSVLTCSLPALLLHIGKPSLLLQNIALSPSELGDLIDVIAGGQASKSIYHDPNKGRAG